MFPHINILRRNNGLNDDFCGESEKASRGANLYGVKSTRRVHARYLYDRKNRRYCSSSRSYRRRNDNAPVMPKDFRATRRLFALYHRRLRAVTAHKKITRCSKCVAPENFPQRRLHPQLSGNRKVRREMTRNHP